MFLHVFTTERLAEGVMKAQLSALPSSRMFGILYVWPKVGPNILIPMSGDGPFNHPEWQEDRVEQVISPS
jgi:hypothetical protein